MRSIGQGSQYVFREIKYKLHSEVAIY